jgi:putative oxidoreductase
MHLIDIGLLVLRLVVGLTFAAHGAQKVFGWWEGPGIEGWRGGVQRMGFDPAPFWATASSLTELVGGLLLAVGLLTPVACGALLGMAIVIIAKVHLPRGFFNTQGGFEFPLVLGGSAVAVLLTGPGAISIDEALGLAFPAQIRLGLLAIGILVGLAAYAASRAGARAHA